MPKVEIIKRIHSPQKQVWEFISDIEKAPEWVVVMKSLIETTENPVIKGTVYRESSKIGLKQSETEWKVTFSIHPICRLMNVTNPTLKQLLRCVLKIMEMVLVLFSIQQNMS